jgi:hypothetical protein
VKSKEQEIVGPNESSCAGVHGERDEFKLDMVAENCGGNCVQSTIHGTTTTQTIKEFHR